MVDVIMAVSKKTLGVVVGIPVCAALAGAAYHYGKVKRQADIEAAAAEEEKAAAYEKWAKEHMDECLELVADCKQCRLEV